MEQGRNERGKSIVANTHSTHNHDMALIHDGFEYDMFSSVKRKRPSSAPQEGKGSPKKLNVSSKKSSSASPTKVVKASSEGKKASAEGKKKTSSDATTASIKVKEADKKSEKVVAKKVATEVTSSSKTTTPVSPKANTKLKAADEKCNELSQRVKILYDQCVTVIKNVPESTWPRKKKKSVKVSIKVPENKKSGDTILFNNPHIAGQKLKVQIPEKLSHGDTFAVSVPMQSPSSEEQVQNKIPKDLVKALYEYSCVYDEWTQAIGTFIPFKCCDQGDMDANGWTL
jgi:hypothetical protein